MIKRYKYINIIETPVDFTDKKIIIWGKCVSGLNLFVKLKAKGYNIIGFTDSFSFEKEEIFAGLPVYSHSDLKNINDTYIYISTTNNESLKDIFELIETLEIENNIILCQCEIWGAAEYNTQKMKETIKYDYKNISFVRDNLEDENSIITYDSLLNYRMSNNRELLKNICVKDHKQYFPNSDIFPISQNEIFVDAGAYNGATTIEFSEWVNNQYDKIYTMEPDKTMYIVCSEYIKIKKINNVNSINKAAYSCSTNLSFDESFESGSSSVKKYGSVIVNSISIDEMLDGEKATYIKMDIEGAEMEALIGAEKTIENFHPKLAISIYHKDDDLWTIPCYLMRKYPFYKFFY